MAYYTQLRAMQQAQGPKYGVQSWEDLYRPTPRPQYPEPPDFVDQFQELPEDMRKQERWRSIAALGQAIGASFDSGQLGTALAGTVGRLGEDRQALVEQYKQKQLQDYARSRTLAEEQAKISQQEADEQESQEQAKERYRLYKQVVDADPALADRAEAAARAGDSKALRDLVDEIPSRQIVLEQYGMTRDDPFHGDQIKNQLENTQWEERQQMAKMKGYEPYYDSPLEKERVDISRGHLNISKEELEMRRQEAAREAAGGGQRWAPTLINRDGYTYVVDRNEINPATGQPKVTRVDSLPRDGQYVKHTDRMGNVYRIDLNTKTVEKVEVENPVDAALGRQRTPPPPPSAVDKADKAPVGNGRATAPGGPNPLDPRQKKAEDEKVDYIQNEIGVRLPPEDAQKVRLLLRRGWTNERILAALAQELGQ